MADALGVVGGTTSPGLSPDTVIEHVVIDHRQVVPGALFVALPGRHTHGRAYAADAVRAGAAAVMVPPPAPPDLPAWTVADPATALQRLGAWALSRTRAQVAAVTGSVGKTSTKWLMAAVLAEAGKTAATPGNFNTSIGLPLAILALDPDTEWFVAEMAMRGLGEIRTLTQIARPHIAVITNIGWAHMEQLGSQANILRAKSEILEPLGPDDAAVLNRRDPWLRTLQPSAGRVLWYGEPGSDAWAEDVATRPGAVVFDLVGPGFREPVTIPWDGVHQVDNALAAACVGLAAGLSPAAVARGLAAVNPAESHLVRRRTARWTILDDTYNASPDSVEAGLKVLAQEPGRRIAVLGDMLELGSVEEEAHRRAGRATRHCADLVLAVGPRARWIWEAAQAVGVAAEWVPDVVAARDWLRTVLVSGDAVYFKASRAMAFEQLVKDVLRWDPS